MGKSNKSAKHKKSNTPKGTHFSKKKHKYLFWILPLAVFTLVMAWNFLRSDTEQSTKTFTPKPADLCKFSPSFITTYQLKQPVAIDFTQKGFTGFRMIEVNNGQTGRILQLPSWDDAGHLGLYTTDRKGNLYTTPIPHISLQENKPEQQNKVYKVDTNSGEMEVFVDLPWKSPPSLNNPYGALGLAYDCDTESLYVSSIAGSGRKEELGQIFQIDLKSGQILNTFEGFDVIGLGVFTTKTGKKLFCGSARDSEIYSIDLDENSGAFSGDVEFVLSLVEQEGGDFDKGHRIRFFEDNRMEVKGVDFNYSLMVASDPMRNIYNFSYDLEKDDWVFMEVYKQ